MRNRQEDILGGVEPLQASFLSHLIYKYHADGERERERKRADSTIASRVIHHRYCRQITLGNCILYP